MQEICRERPHEVECEWVSRIIDGEEALVKHERETTYYWDGDLVVSYEAHVIKLTRDRHLLYYVERNEPLTPKERIWHYVVSEESAELLRKKMAAVETVEDFWTLIQELEKAIEKAAERFYEFQKLVVEEAKKNNIMDITEFNKLSEELKKKVDYCRGGEICIVEDASLRYVYQVEDEYIYPPEDL
jgi:hypothetical protein